jgi:hypothetical protein
MTNSGGEGGCFATGTISPLPSHKPTSKPSQAEGPTDTTAGSTNHTDFSLIPFRSAVRLWGRGGVSQGALPGAWDPGGPRRAGPGNGGPVSGLQTASVTHTLLPVACQRDWQDNGELERWLDSLRKYHWLQRAGSFRQRGRKQSQPDTQSPPRRGQHKKICLFQAEVCVFFSRLLLSVLL